MKKTIVFAIHSLQAGGMERVMSLLANDFVHRMKVELHFILYGINPEIFYPLSQKIIIHQPDFKFDDSKRLYSTLKRLIFLRKTVKRIEPDTILSFGEVWNSFVLIASYGLNIPVYISDRAQPDKVYNKFTVILRNFLYPKAVGIIAQTVYAKELYLNNKWNNNIRVISNPISIIENISEIKKENQILMVARLIETKHHDRLIKIFSKIDKSDWKLVIVGDDAIKQKNRIKLQRLIEKLKLVDKVILTGKQTNVVKYYLESKIFAFTSSSEGFPNVIGEAMSAGLPVVAYDCIAGPSEMIEDGKNGFLIPLFNDELFIQRLELLMRNIELREEMGKQAKKDISKFELNSISDDFYNFILGEN